MSEPENTEKDQFPEASAEAPVEAPVEADDRGGVLESGIERKIVKALEAGKVGKVRKLVGRLHYADVADLLEHLSADERQLFLEISQGDLDPEIFLELDENVRDELIEQLGVQYVATAVTELETDDAVTVVEELSEEEQQQVLDAIPADDRRLIEEGLSYAEDSAGRMMQREVMTVPESWTVGETIDHMRANAEGDQADSMPESFYDIFVVDQSHRPLGSIPLSRLLQARRPVAVTDIMETELKLIPVGMDQEEVAYLFSQRDLVSAPVIGPGGRLVGSITIDDVVDVIHEEHEEDIMRLGGVLEDDLFEAVADTAKARFSWLLINLVTAVLASSIIGLFKATIDQMVALAVLMPIVASMGGNAGTQTLTVAVRALAMKDLTRTNAIRVIGKELIVGGLNGIFFAIITGLVAWVWFGNPALGLVIAAAMIINMIVAGLAGTTIPLLLERSGIDPAIASSVFLTTVTDVVGFAAFLGLASLFIL